MSATHFIRALPAILLAVSPRAFAENPVEETLRKTEARQQQIQADAQKIIAQVSAMIGEYERNGIKSDELASLQKMLGALQKMNAQEMQQVVELIDKARAAGGGKTQLADAYAGQKRLLVALKQLIAAHLRNQQAQEISATIAMLAERQSVNLQNALDLAKWPQQTGGALQIEEARKASIQAQNAEQQAIADEFRLVVGKIDAFVKDLAGAEGDDLVPRYQQGAQQSKSLLPILAMAANFLQQQQLEQAIGGEQNGRAQLKQLAQLLAPAKERTRGLRDAMKDLQEMIAQQRDVVSRTDNIVAHRSNVQQTRDSLTFAQNTEADLTTRADGLAKQFQPDAPEVSSALNNATASIQAARVGLANLNDQNGASVLQNEKDALSSFEKALALLQERTAEEPKRDPNRDQLSRLQELENRTKQLQQAQENAAKNRPQNEPQAKAMAQQEDALRKQTSQLARQAALDEPIAAAQIAQAAAAMQKAADNFEKPDQAANAAQKQTEAATALAKADEMLKSEIAKLEQTKKDLEAAKRAEQQIGNLIREQEKLAADTAKAAPTEDLKPDKVKSLAWQADAGAKQAENIAKQLPQTQTDAQQALGEAQQHMADAKSKLDQANATDAQTAEKSALENLFRAQDALRGQIAMDQAQLGQMQPPTDPGAVQNLAQQLAKAQQQIAEAQDAIDQSQAAAKKMDGQNSNAEKSDAEKNANAQAEKNTAQNSDSAKPNANGEKSTTAQNSSNDKNAANPDAANNSKNANAQANASGQQAADGKQKNSATAQHGPPTPQLQKAAESLKEAANKVADASANNQVPEELQPALREAEQALAQAISAAAMGNSSQAQNEAANAQAALASAQAQLAQASAGLADADKQNGGAQKGENSQGQQGKGQMANNGKGQNQQGQGKGQSEGEGQGQGQNQSKDAKQGKGSNASSYYTSSQTAVEAGPQAIAAMKGKFIGLPARDRRAIEQSQAEKYPQEYGAQVEQYFQNLANSAKK